MNDDALSLQFMFDGPDDAQATLALAHGAGAACDTPFMNAVAAGIGQSAIRVVRFEFPYMAKRRIDGKRRGPDRQEVLLRSWRQVIAHLDAGKLFIGGKSLGARMASMVAADSPVAGLICLGYPFHPPGKPTSTRVSHLEDLDTPALILQGQRDPFGLPDEVCTYRLSPHTQVVWLPDGDHGFKPRKRSGFTEQGNLETAVEAIVRFIHSN